MAFKGYISLVPPRSTSGGDAAHRVRADLSCPLSPPITHTNAYCFTVHHHGVRETPCAEVSCGGKGEGPRRQWRHGTTVGAARGALARMRGAFRDLSGRRPFWLASVVRDILSAIRFGVNVSYPSPGPPPNRPCRCSELPPREGTGGEQEDTRDTASRNRNRVMHMRDNV